MPQEDSTPPFKSSLPELKLPEKGFISTIPEHLLADADPQTRWLMEEVSRNTNATEFACRAAVTHNEHLRTLNGRTAKNEAGLKEVKSDLTVIKEHSEAVKPLLKPLEMLAFLWDYRAFRWACYALAFFFFTYLLPYYLSHPFDLTTVFNHLLGS